MNRRKVLFISLAVVCLVGAAVYSFYCSHIREQNVFDQMYYSRTSPNSLVAFFKDDRALFRSMPEIKTPARGADRGTMEFLGAVAEVYRASCLAEGQHIRFMFYLDTHHLSIDCWIEKDDGSEEWFFYIYDVDDKTLTYSTTAPENLEMKNFLFDRVLPDWFAANGARTRFSLDNLGNYTLIDTTA